MGRFEEEYREALDGLRFSSAGKERIMEKLTQEKAKNRGRSRPLRAALIAAALCGLLVGTAFAASPGLRSLLAEALGGFAPYAQEQEGEAYVIDGIEFRVVSALADDFTIRAYVEARDVDGDIFDKIDNITIPGRVQGGVDIPTVNEWLGPHAVETWSHGVDCLGYDEENRTALLVVSTWKAMPEQLSKAAVEVRAMVSYLTGEFEEVWRNQWGRTIPVKVKPVETTALGKDTALATGLEAEEVRLSPLGLSVVFSGEVWRECMDLPVRVLLTDGTLVEAPWEGGQGSFGAYGTESSRKVLIWNFREPVEADQIEGVYVGDDYFPVK